MEYKNFEVIFIRWPQKVFAVFFGIMVKIMFFAFIRNKEGNLPPIRGTLKFLIKYSAVRNILV